MNLPRIYLVAILLLTFPIGANGQEPPKAVLVDEHGILPCDDNLARIDNWYSELSKEPNSVGLVVIASPPEKKHLSVFREQMMKAYAKLRGAADILTFRYVRATSQSDFTVQLWKVPPRATEPEIENADMSFSLPKNALPFLLGAEYKIGDEICPDPSDEPVFASFLKANPSARGNIVIRERTIAKARQKAAQILRKFRKQYGISGRRLRTFSAILTKPSNHDEPIVEYWYLP